MSRTSDSSQWAVRLLVVVVSIGLHAALLVWLFSSQFRHAAPQERQVVAVELVEIPPPPPEPEPQPEPEPEPEPEPQPEPEPEPPPKPPVVERPTPPPAQPPKPRGPPVHSFGANQQWAAPQTPAPSAQPSSRGRMAPSGYADTVKNRVIANLKRPEGSVYKPPPGYKGDPNDFKRQCYIPYEITIDGSGRMVSFEIDRCGDAVLDQAAEQAIRSAGPFPAPPGDGGGQYIIYGTAIFIK